VRGWCGECDGGKGGGVVAGQGAAIFQKNSGFTGRFLRERGRCGKIWEIFRDVFLLTNVTCKKEVTEVLLRFDQAFNSGL